MTSIASRLVAVSALALAHPGVSHAIGDLGDNATDKPLSSEDSHKALLSTITWPGEMKASVFATQPDVQDPTAIAFDEQNRLYVAETHRFARGIEDNRRNGHWLRDEIALSSTAERLQMYLKHQNVRPLSHYTEYSEVVRVLEDKDNDGVADEARIFADGFRDPLDGTAAGIMAANGKVYLACIPHVWELRDTDGDGVADYQNSLDGSDPLAAFRISLQGGDVGAGRRIFYGHSAAECSRCHVGLPKRQGGDAGPSLSNIGHLDPEYLLESIVLPNAKTAAGFGIISLTFHDGTMVAGRLMKEDAGSVTLADMASGKSTTYPRKDIASSTQPASTMPPMGAILNKSEIRDLIAFLKTLRHGN